MEEKNVILMQCERGVPHILSRPVVLKPTVTKKALFSSGCNTGIFIYFIY